MSWSSSDNYFVSSKLEVFTVNLSSDPLEMTLSKDVVYDGPTDDDFRRLLRIKNLRVNRQGKAIIRIQKRDDDGELLEGQYDTIVLEMVVQLGPFGFQNVPLPKPQVVNELESLLDDTKAELAKKNDELTEMETLLDNTKAEKNEELNELRSLLDNSKAELEQKKDELSESQSLVDSTKAELAKNNDELNEFKQQKIEEERNAEQFRLTMVDITNSIKRVFVNFDLEAPANGDPKSVLEFLEVLRRLIFHKEFKTLHDLNNLHTELDSTFLVAANGVLASIARAFEERSGFGIDMETNSPSSRARLIENLLTLRSFLVDSHFFIDGGVIVKDFHLMNEDDLPVFFRDSTADLAELKQREKGTKSLDNIDEKSILYGYFNIPVAGMFKGVLTRVHVNLPDEIMVKLRVSGRHKLNNKRFWFVHANGSAIFEEEPQRILESLTENLELVKFAPFRVLGERNNFFEFLRRMNRTFVNKKGTYFKFEFVAANFTQPRYVFYNSVGYLDKDLIMADPFKVVQYDMNTRATDIEHRRVQLPSGEGRTLQPNTSNWIVNGALGNDCAFTFKDICFVGKITKVSDTFRENALVSVFFEQTSYGENCYVDALATTFFVLNTEEIPVWKTTGKVAPKFIP